MSLFAAQENRRARIEQVRANSVQSALVTTVVSTSGIGQVAYEDPINFGVAFIKEPSVAYGCYVDEGAVDTEFPVCSGGVYRWIRDEQGSYTGACVYVVVQGIDVPVEHHFGFQEMAVKYVAGTAESGASVSDRELLDM